ncbi:MAG: 30S ribosomal protein S10, partial [Pyrobaculum sp.]
MGYIKLLVCENVYKPRNYSTAMSLAARRKVRIRLYGTNPADVEQVAREIVDLAKKMGVQ